MMTKTTRAHQEMRYPNVTWHNSYLFTYLPLNTLYFRNIFWVTRTCYIFNGRIGLRKAPRVYCYYPLSVFLAYTSLLSVVSRFIQEAQLMHRDREHTVSWDRVKCCTRVRRITFEKSQQPVNDLQGHSRSLSLLLFHRPYTIS